MQSLLTKFSWKNWNLRIKKPYDLKMQKIRLKCKKKHENWFPKNWFQE